MKKFYIFFLVMFCSIMGFINAHSQNYSFNADSLDLISTIRTLEKYSGKKFFYRYKDIDTVKVEVNRVPLPLDKIFKLLGDQTKLKFSLIDDNIYITKFSEIISLANVNKNLDIADVDHLNIQKQTKTLMEIKEYTIGRKSANKTQVILRGYIKNKKTGESIDNAVIYNNSISVNADNNGFYNLVLAPGKYIFNILGNGMHEIQFKLNIYEDGELNFEMLEKITTLKNVVVSAQKVSKVNTVLMGVEKLNIETIKKIPSVFGEPDILRAITSLPGVKTVGEASTGFNVRGGSADQNLILFNDNTIYNPSHLFGMFSAFNPEIVKDIELYKSSMPARFGGRLASVLDVTSREGNKKKLTGTLGLGLITSRVTLEGPIKSEKTSFVLAGRTTYANWLLKLLPDEYEKSRANFQDFNFAVTHDFDSTSKIIFSAYYSRDRFKLASDTIFGYNNLNFSLRWNKKISRKFSRNLILANDNYKYIIGNDFNKYNAFDLSYKLSQLNFRSEFNYIFNSKSDIDFGFSTIRYNLNPGKYIGSGDSSKVVDDILHKESAFENAIYAAYRYKASQKLILSGGVRLSNLLVMGGKPSYTYIPNGPISEGTVESVKNTSSGEIVKTYFYPEIRSSLRYLVDNTFSIKAGINTQAQYIHMLSNTTMMAPTDIWKLSDEHIKPQKGIQYSLGAYKNLASNTIETSVEVYYKQIKDYLDYKPGAQLILNHNIERDVVNTNGRAYGIELLIKKLTGRWNGWIGYTYSRIELKNNNPQQGFMVNNGNYYAANYDKPHEATVLINFKASHRFNFSVNSTYSTGRPITLPIGKYYYEGSERVLYSDRNAYRIPDYYRTDFVMNIEGNHKVKKLAHSSWSVGLYNVFGRRNPYSVYFISENGRIEGYKMSIIGNIIPFINFNLRF
ncbi:TonB-dependent receptor plug domain-containing protein [Polluticaenibacter yanchengensis]|uniref:TonB-dependent receptor plug domain-containing protein n=1 Tax=Polluticaenibacter yanchengensis TaxID=3014562 RepID=A0ABT4UH85_9BACT|nr:TonB-dependent receptor plug domain-containing protein [Chitinophagaceae bacterium LY-5]